MKKPLDFRTYQVIRKMSFNDMNRWITSIYSSALQEGINTTNDDVVAELTEDRLYEIIKSVKGIGEKRAKEATEKILAEGVFDGTKT